MPVQGGDWSCKTGFESRKVLFHPRRVLCRKSQRISSKNYVRKKLAAYIASVLPFISSSAELGAKTSAANSCIFIVYCFFVFEQVVSHVEELALQVASVQVLGTSPVIHEFPDILGEATASV